MTGATSVTVLVVDDEKEHADTYALRMQERYDVRTAYGGEAALEKVGQDVDVVVLDRLMPGVSGDEVLRGIRDRNLDCRIIMLTCIDPEVDSKGMPFDEYLCKPVDGDDLLAAVEHQLRIVASERLSEYFHLTSKRADLEVGLDDPAMHDEYVEVTSRMEGLGRELAGLVDRCREFTLPFESDGVRADVSPATAALE
jgi:DNA-binding response OmpR family regulator